MAVMVQSQLPIAYDQFLALESQINSEKIVPPGCLVHIVSQNDNGITITDVWEDEASAMAFINASSEAAGMEIPPMTLTKVFELHP
jgi:hypothetical protein